MCLSSISILITLLNNIYYCQVKIKKIKIINGFTFCIINVLTFTAPLSLNTGLNAQHIGVVKLRVHDAVQLKINIILNVLYRNGYLSIVLHIIGITLCKSNIQANNNVTV